MAEARGKIDITKIDESRLPKRDRIEHLQKIWYKFSLSKVSVVGLAIVILVVLAAIFYKFIVPYPDGYVIIGARSESLENTGVSLILPNFCAPANHGQEDLRQAAAA